MTISYKLIPFLENDPVSVQLLENGVPKLNIPFYPGNTDYERYLEWLAEGNTPLPPDKPNLWEAIRQKRDQLIRDSDWTMIPGATVDQAQWSAYRQILRDLPQTYSNPEDVVWPTPPSTSGPNTIEE